MAAAEPQTSAPPCHHPSAAASPRRSVGVGCEDGALAERTRRPEPHPRAQHPGTSRYKKKTGTDPPQPYQRASAEQPEPQTPRPNPRVSDGREVSAMRIPPTLPPPRAKSALRFGVRRWGIRIRAQRSEHGYGPPTAAGIMSTATCEASERASEQTLLPGTPRAATLRPYLAEWRNGRRGGFKIRCPYGCVGSSPTSATSGVRRASPMRDSAREPSGSDLRSCAEELHPSTSSQRRDVRSG